MPPKQKKLKLWCKCLICKVEVPHRDSKTHGEFCQSESPKTPFIKDDIFYGVLELTTRSGENKLNGGYVSLHNSVIQICGFTIGEPVLINCQDHNLKPIVKRIWPTAEINHLTSAVVCVEDIDVSWQQSSNLKVCLSKFSEPFIIADSVQVIVECSEQYSQGLMSFLKYSQKNNVLSVPGSFNVKYLGKQITAQIILVNNLKFEESGCKWFLCNESTKWILHSSTINSVDIPKNINVAGVNNIISDIFSVIKAVFQNESNHKLLKSVLLYGPSGTGKTFIANHLISKSNVNVVRVNTSEIYSKFYGETESTLKKLFGHAINNSPSIVFIDDIDILCPKRASSGTDQEKRITSTLCYLLDDIHNVDTKVFVLCCSSKPDIIDPSLRRYGRIDHEIEVPIPDQSQRFDIFQSMLHDISHKLSNEEIKLISDSAHGYVGADIMNLCTQASMHMLLTNCSENTISLKDFHWALNHVNPSAMREVLVDVPNVKWTDIGGQDDLKLKLKQLVEWPLKFTESFSRLGIKPPSGILLYGPPGCSKTMIAKAVATESHLNFLSIKGPELFSKWVGDSEKAVRELFRKARQVAPSVIFFDEIDALGGERSKSSNSSNVQERVLAQLLTEMDGITPLGNITIIAATNRPDKIDSALLRPGRLDRIVHVPLPNESTRKSIYEIRLAKMPMCKSVNIDELVSRSKGYSGAEIIALCHEAALKALEENIDIQEVSSEHFDKAFEIVKPRTPSKLLYLYEEFGKNL